MALDGDMSRRMSMSTPRRRVETIKAPPLLDPAVNYYDRQRVACSVDEKKMASLLSGHTWNILNGREDHEVYLQHARNPDHYIDIKTGRNTSHWFEKKMRVDLDGDGIIDCVDSTNVQETMVCPGTAGKESAHLRNRQAKQICQSAAPRDYAQYTARRAGIDRAPPTPPPLASKDALNRTVGQQGRMRDTHDRPTPRCVSRDQWTPRRGERLVEPQPPGEGEMFRAYDQLRTESHFDTSLATLAEGLPSRRSASMGLNTSGALPRPRPWQLGGAAGIPSISAANSANVTASSLDLPPGASALSGASTARSMMLRDDAIPKPAHERVRHSKRRMEPQISNEITGWPFHGQDKTKRDDAYFSKPMLQTGSSSVKYDIISGDRRNFWY